MNPYIDLTGSVALVTGGSRGIGAASAILLAKAGADVVVFYRKDRVAAGRIAQRISALGRECRALKVDVGSPRAVQTAIERVVERFGKLDIVVNSAGIWTYAAIGRLTRRTWDETLSINLNGTVNICNSVAPFMKKQRSGKIINIASTAGQRGEAFHSHYAASKGAIIAFTKSISAELAPFNVHVNCVAPGWVDTDMTAGVLSKRKYRNEMLKSIPRGKIASPEDIAGPILFLASHLSDHMIGTVLSVNGGSVLAD
jgi:3-oxoacyl-[acyl-carrier protein] reductase